MPDHLPSLLNLLDSTLSLKGRALNFTRATPLLGSVPELDSMAVVSLLTSIEETYGIVVEDDDIDASVFATVGSLLDYVTQRA
jgi:acyl carrier protein